MHYRSRLLNLPLCACTSHPCTSHPCTSHPCTSHPPSRISPAHVHLQAELPCFQGSRVLRMCRPEPCRLEHAQLEEEIAVGAAAKLTAAAYEDPGSFLKLYGDAVRPDRKVATVERAAHQREREQQTEAQLLARVPLGGLCWASTLGIAGCQQRFKSRLVAVRALGGLVRFLSDEVGRSDRLFLPAPTQQIVRVEAIERWVEPTPQVPQTKYSTRTGAAAQEESNRSGARMLRRRWGGAPT